MQILLVEDDSNLVQIFSGVLRSAGHEVSHASNGAVALEMAKAAEPELILMDLQMPVMDGIEATHRLRDAGIETTIIALTNQTLPAEVNAALDAGCDGYIVKPLVPQDLADEIALLFADG